MIQFTDQWKVAAPVYNHSSSSLQQTRISQPARLASGHTTPQPSAQDFPGAGPDWARLQQSSSRETVLGWSSGEEE